MKLGVKLFLGFFSVIVVFLIGLVILYTELKGIEENVGQMDRRSERSLDLAEIRSLYREKRAQLLDYLIESNPEFVQNYKERVADQEELFQKIEEKMRTEKQKKLYADIVKANQITNETFLNEMIPAIEQGDLSRANKLLKFIIQPQRRIIVDSIEELIQTVNEEKDQAIDSASKAVASSILVLLVITVLSVLLCLGIALFMGRKITYPIRKVQEVSVRIAQGDLTVEQVEVRSKDELGQLAQSINTMAENIRGLIQEAAKISEKVSASSEELMASSSEMMNGIEQVSATTEELASGSTTQANHAAETLEMIQQVALDINQIYRDSQVMAESSQKANISSHHGLQSVEKSTHQMKMIEEKVSYTANLVQVLNEKSKEISQILGVIHTIAAQTNLLALNAAIEAARAGEQGRGFAVVADEVRKLAEQASASTHQIGDIIQSVQQETMQAGTAMDEVVQEVRLGSEIIDDNGKAFGDIAHLINEMAEKIKDVSIAAEQIRQQSDQAVESVEGIASITEESSAGTEELAASMEQQSASMQEINGMAVNLAKMAEQLNLSIAKFKY